MEQFGSRPVGNIPNVASSSTSRFSRAHVGPSGVPQHPSMIFSQGQTGGSGLPLNYPLPEPHWRPEQHHSTGTQVRGKRLRVEDALSYLEQVKQQFVQAPEVYGDFLDIMKEFKSQTIDTPGVICRVSRLFRGRPNLIIGFNTFLPPGFEVRLDGNRIIISEPNGQTRCIDDGSPERSTVMVSELPAERVLTPASTASNVELHAKRVEEVEPEQHIEVVVAPAPPPVPSQASTDLPSTSHAASDSPAVGIENAMQYVSKIKARFQDRPEIYQKFLRILQDYQNHQKQRHQRQKDSDLPSITEGQVYRSVALLFKNEPDLLNEFSRFLPDASCFATCEQPQQQRESPNLKAKQQRSSAERNTMHMSPLMDAAKTIAPETPSSAPTAQPSVSQKRASAHSSSHGPAAKKAKGEGVKVVVSEANMNEGMKLGTVDDFMFFDKVRRLFADNSTYHAFLRCLVLYNQDIISRTELVDLVTPLLGRRPDLMKTLKEMLGMCETVPCQPMEPPPPKPEERDGIPSGVTYQIDFATCKRLGVSYRSLPDSFPPPVCSGRTPLCYSVLNDTWVSFPSWSSEDTSCVHSKKTQYEEFIYKTEDERFELDIIIEVNKAALENLIFLENKIKNMSKAELNKFRLDASLGSSSPSLMYRALKRIYGEHVHKMLEGAQKNPSLVVPRLIERLRLKDSEWREAQAGFNRVWREQTEKYYAKSLDHQALTFKQNDLKLLRSKMIIHHFETLYDERESRMEEGGPPESGPHCILDYPQTETSVFYDVNDLIIHYVKRQQSIQKGEKKQAKRFLKRIIPEFFNIPAQPMSDEEDDEESHVAGDLENGFHLNEASTSNNDGSSSTATSESIPKHTESEREPSVAGKNFSTYRLFYGANTWCVFLRLHQMLCDRFARLKTKNANMVMDYKIEEKTRLLSNTTKFDDNKDAERGIHLLKKNAQNPENFYKDLICAIKNVLDGQIEASAFEDLIRSMFGIDAYVTFTMDKIITTLGRQLQAMFTEELNNGTLDLYHKYRFERPVSSIMKTKNESEIEAAYEAAAQKLLTNQNCFKTFFLHDRRKVTVELIDSETVDEGNEENEEADKKWSQYINYYLKSAVEEPSTSLTVEEHQQLLEELSTRRVFLMRNVKAGLEHNRKKEEEAKRRSKLRGKGKADREKDSGAFHVKEDLHVQFSPAGHYQMRFVESSAEVLIRTRAPRRGAHKHKMVVARRKERFTSWLEERLCEESGEAGMLRNWLSEGSKMIQIRHRVFPYLTYNRYVTSAEKAVPASNTSARS